MSLPEDELKKNRFSGLSAMLGNTNSEITRYRDYEWKITAWSLALIIGASGVQGFGDNPSVYVKGALSTFTACVAIFSICYLQIIHTRLIWNMKLRRKIEMILGFYSSDVYETAKLPEALRSKTLLPECWQETNLTFWHGANLIVACWLLIGLAELYVLVSLWIAIP